MTTTKRAEMMERIERHGRELLAIFTNADERDPVTLCKKLRRIETKAHRLATQWCNGEIDSETWERDSDACLSDVVAILCPHTADMTGALMVNGDARGYALKIDDAWMRAHRPRLHSDWGGYGIIAPDLTEND